MTGIPSDIGASAAQAGYQAREVAKARDAARASGTNAANRQVNSIDEASDTVDTSDDNTQVYADAEGAGSMGKQHEETEEDKKTEQEAEDGIVRDDQGQLHLDLEA